MQTIIFDFDGTLADTFHYIPEIINKLAPKFGYKKLTKTEIESLRGMSAFEIIKKFKISKLQLIRMLLEGREELSREMKNVRAFAGIKELLTMLKAKGYKIGIISSNSENNIQSFLVNNDLSVDFIKSENSLFGKARVINDAIKEHSLNRKDVVYVGDEIRDIEACSQAKVKCISVTWGYNNEEVLKTRNNIIACNAKSILEILKEP